MFDLDWRIFVPVVFICLAPFLGKVADILNEAEDKAEEVPEKKGKGERAADVAKDVIASLQDGAFAPLMWYAVFLLSILLAFPHRFRLWYGQGPMPQWSFLAFQAVIVLFAITSQGRKWTQRFFQVASIVTLFVILFMRNSPFQPEINGWKAKHAQAKQEEIARAHAARLVVRNRLVWKMYPGPKPAEGERWRVHNPHDYHISAKVGVYSKYTPPEIPPGEDWYLNIKKLCGEPPFYIRLREGDSVTSVKMTRVK